MRLSSLLPALLFGAILTASAAPMKLDDYLALRGPAPTAKLAYGPAPSQYAELFVPQGAGPFPVAVLVHGGCWTSKFGGIVQFRNMAGALAARGIAVWNVEYRRVDEDGGGYPGMYLDMHAALELLAAQASTHRLDLQRIVAVGHSAGGQLVQWIAGRARIPAGSPLYRADALKIERIVSLGGLADLRHEAALIKSSCGRDIAQLAGAPSSARPDVLADTNAADLMPNGSRTWLVTGALDTISPPRVAYDYAARAKAAGDQAEVVILPQASHYDEVAASSPAWPQVLGVIEQALGQPAATATAIGGRWSRGADAALARQEIYPTAVDGTIYVAGGVLSDKPGFTAAFEAYDVAADTWSTLAPLPEGRHHIALAPAAGRIYGLGGFSGEIPHWRAHDTVFVYDPASDRWSPGPTMPQARAEGVSAVIDDRIYMIGGRTPARPDAAHFRDHADTNRGDVLDVRSGQWQRIADAPSERNSAAAAVIGNRIYVVGGRQLVKQPDGSQKTVNVATLEVYDPARDRWETRASLPLAQGGLAAAAHGGKLYAFGGEQFVPERKVFNKAWVYDPALDRWSALPPMPTPRHGHGAVTVGERIYLMGGGEKVGPVDASHKLEVFAPAGE